MADTITLSAGTADGAVVATDDAGAAGHVQIVKLAVSADGSATAIGADNTNGLDVDVTRVSGNVSVVGPAADGAAVSGNPVRIAGSDGTNVQDISVTTSGHVQIHDGGNSITVDGTVGVSGTVTVDGSGVTQPISHANLGNLHSADFDTGAGTDTTPAIGIAVPASGGAAVVGGDNTNGLDVDVTRVSGNVTVVQATATNLKVDASSVAVPVTDNGATLSIDDGGGAITVDGTVGISGTVTVDSELTTADLDTGAGTDTRAVVGLVGSASGGGQLIPGSSADGLLVNLGANNDVTVTGSVTANAGTNLNTSALALESGGNLAASATSLALLDDAVFTDDAAYTPGASKGLVVMAQADETTPDSVDEGDAGALRMTLARGLHVNLRDDAGDSVMDGANNAVRVNIVAGAGSGGTALADDAAFTVATTSFTPVGGIVTSDSVDAGDGGAFAMLANRQQKVTLYDSSGVEVSVGGGTQYDEDTASATGQKVTMAGVTRADTAASQVDTDGDRSTLIVDASGRLHVNVGTSALPTGAATLAEQQTQTTALQLIDDGIATTGSAIPTKGMAAVGTDGTNARILKTDTSGELQVDILTLPNVTLAAGTNTNEVVGDAAHDAAIAGNPVRIGGRALTADYTAVAAGDTADLITTLLGKQVVYPYANPNQSWSYAAASGGITNTTGVTIKTAAGAGVRNYLTDLQVINGHATVSTDVQIRDGASGTVLWRGFAQAAGGGVAVSFDVPLRGTANTLLEVACGTTGAAVYVNASGFTAAE